MTFFDATILGIVEGITEFLPVSSTGHLILASKFLGLPSTEFLKSFEITIQLGAILAVVLLYWKQFLSVPILKKIAVAFIPTAFMGFFAYPFVKSYLLESASVVIWSLLLGGIIMIAFEKNYRNKTTENIIKPIGWFEAMLIGIFQSIAIIPGVSRSGATIIGGLALGINRKEIVEFSFLLAVPTMMAATGLDLLKSYESFAQEDFLILAVGFVVSFIGAIAAIKFLLRYIQKNSFIPFGVYRIIFASIIAVFLWL